MGNFATVLGCVDGVVWPRHRVEHVHIVQGLETIRRDVQ